MATQYTDILKLALPTTGELSGTWGDTVNDNITSMVEEAIAGLATIDSWTTNSHTLTTANGTTSESRAAMLVLDDDGAGNPSAAATVICPDKSKLYMVYNNCGQTATIKTSAGTGIAVPNGETAWVYCDGTNVNEALTNIVNFTSNNVDIGGGQIDGTPIGANSASTGAFTSVDINSSTVVDGVLDEDNMASNSATKLATQQSIKAYVDAQVGANNELSEVLANGNTSGGTNLVMSAGDTLTADTIGETTSGAGVTIDSVLLKDDTVNASDVETTYLSANDGTQAAVLESGTGKMTIASSVLTTTDINGGTVDNVTIGGATPGLITGTTITANTAVSTDTINEKTTAAGVTIDSVLLKDDVVNATDIETGSISANDGTASATIANSTGVMTIASSVLTTTDINGGTIDGVTIGGSSAGAITGTTITGTSFVTSGNMTFGDNDKATFGTGGDLEIYHDGSNSYIKDAGTGNLVIESNGTAVVINESGADVDFRIESDTNANAFFLEGSSGNVGIGTSSPTSALHILVPSTASSPNTALVVTDGTTSTFSVKLNNNVTSIVTGGGGETFTIENNGAERLRIDSAGNVGIGTSSPTNTLSVAGNANITGNTTLGDASTDTVTVNGYMGVGGAANNAYGAYIQSETLGGGFQYGLGASPRFNSAATSWGAAVVTAPRTDATTFTALNIAGLRAANATKGSGSTITNQFGVYIDDQTQGTNNFGITSLVSSGTNKWNIYASGTAANYFAGNVQFAAGSAAAPALTRFGDDNTGIFFPAADTLAASTAGTERLRIDSSGNLGLGATPSAWISSIRAIDVSSASAFWGYMFGGTSPRTLVSNNSYLNNVGSNIYKVSAGAMQYEQRSDVHVWSTAPSGTAGNAITFTERAKITTTEMVVNDPGNDYDFRVESDTNTHALFVQGSDGNVGIGTSTPAARLHALNTSAGEVARFMGNASENFANGFRIEATGTTNRHLRLISGLSQVFRTFETSTGNAANDSDTVFDARNKIFRNSDGTSEQVRITSAGNVLIGGTVSPASATKALALFNGVVPTGSVTDGCVLYTEDVSASSELKVRDEAGNVTTLSPHNFSMIPEGPSEDMAWAYYSEKGGKRINVDMLKLARMVEKLTGEKLVYEN